MVTNVSGGVLFNAKLSVPENENTRFAKGRADGS